MPNIFYLLLRRLRSPLILMIVVYAVSIFGFVLIPGVDDQGNPWRMDFFHAFYFVSFMGSTIGFGEIPYAFTEPQRLWATICIYGTVVSWLYGIGSTLTTLQDPAFRKLLTDSKFRRQVARIREPFYLICGYGDTGGRLVSALAEEGIRSVVVESDQERINVLELDDIVLPTPRLCADAARPETLIMAGLEHPYCAGVVALSANDKVNLKIAITSHLLRPKLRMISRSQTKDAEKNIASFGANEIINAFDTFAGRLSLALHSPGMFVLFEWMTGVPHEQLQDPVFPPKGKWVLCGYGRFGKAVYERLVSEGVETTIIEADPELTDAPEDIVVGRGTEADTLKEAGIAEAAGIVAGTDNDANNLSILMTARELNPDLFSVVRQNRKRNDVLFDVADTSLVMQRGSVIAHKIFALIRTPLMGHFLRQASQQDKEWANALVARISGVVTDEVPLVWELTINSEQAPTFYCGRNTGKIHLKDLFRDPRDREKYLPCIPMMLRRGYDNILLPEDDTKIKDGDRLMFCGQNEARQQMQWTVQNDDVLMYVLTGEEHPSGYLWKWWRGLGMEI
ncbi:MAG: potassium transporter TrkA [Thiothrix sp.]|nr:MAG: potassium transporter TrkA [Thiothrix sp.]